MYPEISPRTKPKLAQKVITALPSYLRPGESMAALARTNNMRPMLDAIVITTERVIGVSTTDLDARGVRVSVEAGDITHYDTEKKMTGVYLRVTRSQTEVVSFGAVEAGDVVFVRTAMDRLLSRSSGSNPYAFLDVAAQPAPPVETPRPAVSLEKQPSPRPASPAAPAVGNTPSLASELRGLADLFGQGLLTSDEFTEAKRSVLRRYKG